MTLRDTPYTYSDQTRPWQRCRMSVSTRARAVVLRCHHYGGSDRRLLTTDNPEILAWFQGEVISQTVDWQITLQYHDYLSIYNIIVIIVIIITNLRVILFTFKAEETNEFRTRRTKLKRCFYSMNPSLSLVSLPCLHQAAPLSVPLGCRNTPLFPHPPSFIYYMKRRKTFSLRANCGKKEMWILSLNCEDAL